MRGADSRSHSHACRFFGNSGAGRVPAFCFFFGIGNSIFAHRACHWLGRRAFRKDRNVSEFPVGCRRNFSRVAWGYDGDQQLFVLGWPRVPLFRRSRVELRGRLAPTPLDLLTSEVNKS